jgi:hypothetical protein
MSDFPLGVVVVLIWAVICGAIYIIPSVVAFKRDHPNRWIIFAINMAFGATVIGWIGALVWALNAAHISNQAGGSHGGESGLNLFVNDEKRVRWPDSPAPQPSAAARPRTVENAVDEIERLRQLFVDQHLTVDEFNRLKASVLAGL